MYLETSASHLSRISTPWSIFRCAHGEAGDNAVHAQRLLLQRYCGAAYRYLLGALKDDDASLELLHEFVVRFLRGAFRRADANTGRFRDYLKTALIHLVTDYYREQRARPQPLPVDMDDRAITADSLVEQEANFVESWREELIHRTWMALAEAKPTYHAVLIFCVENPELPSARAAEQLTARLGKSFTAANVRVTLQRAREKFAELLIEEVAHSLGNCSEKELADELRALHILKLCASSQKKANCS